MTSADAAVVPCPRCDGRLGGDGLEQRCTTCGRSALVLRFVPVTEAEELAAGSGRCANHLAKEAVASCVRCGSYVCDVCLTRTGEHSLCPACFDTLHDRGELDTTRARRVRWDHAALYAAAASFLCSAWLGIVGGPLALGLAIFAFVRRRREPWLSPGRIAAAFVLGALSLGIAVLVLASVISLGRHR